MPLESSCAKYRDKLVFVLPIIGFGWCEKSAAIDRFEPDPIEVPLPFFACILKFHNFAEEIRAAIGIVEQSGHALDKLWVALLVRDGLGSLTFNFASDPAEYNVILGEVEPIIHIDEENLPMPEWAKFPGSSELSGLGHALEKPESLEKLYARVRRARASE
jgi:hypothetical protein